jgi:hypothetical protein
MQGNFLATLLRIVAAIVGGNLIYYLLLVPVLPSVLRHQRGKMDAGLFLAFLICVAVWGVLQVRGGRRPRR